jgi:tetratricopeptide (TPR) repeat protein
MQRPIGSRRRLDGSHEEAQVSQEQSGSPAGDVYDWYTRGIELLRSGNSRAATLVLRRVVEAEPQSRAAREALARAEYDSGDFARNLDADPADDYAAFGVGLCSSRLGEHRVAVEHLAMAVAMRPGNHHYSTALRAARVRAQ